MNMHHLVIPGRYMAMMFQLRGVGVGRNVTVNPAKDGHNLLTIRNGAMHVVSKSKVAYQVATLVKEKGHMVGDQTVRRICNHAGQGCAGNDRRNFGGINFLEMVG